MRCVRWQAEGLLISRLPLSREQAHREVAPVAAAGGGHLAAQDLGVPPLSAERGEAEVELAAAATEAASTSEVVRLPLAKTFLPSIQLFY